MEVRLVARTVLEDDLPYAEDWQTDAGNDAARLSEFAGRVCYRSFGKGKQSTARNAEYLKKIVEQRHFSVLEHVCFTFWVRGVSRALSHEIARHRHLSLSQLSTRYTGSASSGDRLPYVVHPTVRALGDATCAAMDRNIVDNLLWHVSSVERMVAVQVERELAKRQDLTPRQRRKLATEAARLWLPHALPTEFVVTGNARAWAVFLKRRASLDADAEICALAVEIWRHLDRHFPEVFGFFLLRREEGWPHREFLECQADFE